MAGTTVTPNNSVETIVNRIMKWKRITRLDQNLLMSELLSKESIGHEDKLQIDRLFDALNKGLLRVV